MFVARHLHLPSSFTHLCGAIFQQKSSLVNVKLKWVKDSSLDKVVYGEADLKAAWELKDAIASEGSLPVHHLSKLRKQLGLAHVKVSSFLRRYPTVFEEFTNSRQLPCFRLTEDALQLYKQELQLLKETESESVDRLRKLLMLTSQWMLPLQTIDQLVWDMGLPSSYFKTMTSQYRQFFNFVTLPDDRIGLQLSFWDQDLAISNLQKEVGTHWKPGDCLAFPVKFTRGYGLKRKCMAWLQEWQTLPYTSPYADPSALDPRTDISEKRIVGVFHELLHLTISKRTERKNLSNLRKPLQLPQKFTKVFERQRGIFYISQKCGTQRILLREAYEGSRLIEKHPVMEIRYKFVNMMAKGRLIYSRGLSKIREACNDDFETSKTSV